MEKIKVICNTNYGIDKVPDYIKENRKLKKKNEELERENRIIKKKDEQSN